MQPCSEGTHTPCREILVCGSLKENGRPLLRLTGRKSCACQNNCQNRKCYIDFPDPAIIPKYSIFGWKKVSGYGTQQRNMGTQFCRRALFPEEQVIGPFRATVRTPKNPFAPHIFRVDPNLLNVV